MEHRESFLRESLAELDGLPSAIRLVTKAPAEATGLRDRGEIALGKRADLLLDARFQKYIVDIEKMIDDGGKDDL